MKSQRPLGEQVVTVMLARFGVARDFQPALIVVEIFGEIIMGVVLIQIAEPGVETLIGGTANRASVAERPFADAATAIARSHAVPQRRLHHRLRKYVW